MSGLGRAAQVYALHDLPVFPVEPRGKRPLVEHGLHDASTNSGVIACWWSRWPAANIGLPTGAVSGLVVIDVDSEEGYEALLGLQRSHGAPLRTTWVRTPREGWHGYLLHHGEHVPNSAGKLAPGLDIRGDGGYVVAPPSVGANGARYRRRERAPIAPMPPWLLCLLRPGPAVQPPRPATVASAGYGAAALRSEAEAVAHTAPGQRNLRLFIAAARMGELVGAGLLTQVEVETVLGAAALAVGLTQREAEATISSGLRHGRAQPRRVGRP